MEAYVMETEADQFGTDCSELELWRVPTLEEVISGLNGRMSYKFASMGLDAIIAVDGVGSRKGAASAAPVTATPMPGGKPRIVGIKDTAK